MPKEQLPPASWDVGDPVTACHIHEQGPLSSRLCLVWGSARREEGHPPSGSCAAPHGVAAPRRRQRSLATMFQSARVHLRVFHGGDDPQLFGVNSQPAALKGCNACLAMHCPTFTQSRIVADAPLRDCAAFAGTRSARLRAACLPPSLRASPNQAHAHQGLAAPEPGRRVGAAWARDHGGACPGTPGLDPSCPQRDRQGPCAAPLSPDGPRDGSTRTCSPCWAAHLCVISGRICPISACIASSVGCSTGRG
jgi:hypothetical protein